jgi:hypothetical protein
MELIFTRKHVHKNKYTIYIYIYIYIYIFLINCAPVLKLAECLVCFYVRYKLNV